MRLATGMAVLAAVVTFSASAIAQSLRSQDRAERRAYAGAPPAMPHPPLGAVCTSCHGGEPMVVESLGVSPASPHRNQGQMSHCRQCHVSVDTSSDLFRHSDFAGLRPAVETGHRAHSMAPPMIPHKVFMRENCLACHGGAAARPEILTSHEDRIHCRQCHLTSSTLAPAAAHAE